MNKKALFFAVAGILVVVFVVAGILSQKYASAVPAVALDPNRDVTLREGAVVFGPADAKVTIVEFLDPACGACKQFSPVVKRFVDQYPGQVKVMVRYAPLHTGSDEVVKMLEAAKRQGQFWPALELLFDNPGRWIIGHISQPPSALELMASLDLDHEQLIDDLDHPEVVAAVQQDMDDLKTLGIKATPEFFVNKKPMPSFGYRQLAQLVEDAVAETYGQ